MNFNPQSEQDITDRKPFRVGTYDFEILSAAEKPSKRSGKPMIELKLKVFGPDASTRIVFDYLLAETPLKLRHAAEACGLLAKYNTGLLTSGNFRFRRGKLSLDIERDKTEQYPDKNVVADYIAVSAHGFKLLA